MRNFDRIGLSDLQADSSRRPATEENSSPIGLGEYISAKLETIWAEDITGRVDMVKSDFAREEIKKMVEFDSAIAKPADKITYPDHVWYQDPAVTERIKTLQDMYPEKGFKTWDQLSSDVINPHFAKLRKTAYEKGQRLSGGQQLLGDLIAGSTMLADPMLLPTLFISAPSRAAVGAWDAARVALSTGAKEAGIIAVGEIPVQTMVALQKHTIDSPFGLKDAVFNIVMAAGGGGIIRAGGSVAFDTVQLRKLANQKREAGGTKNEAEANTLEQYADTIDDAEGGMPGDPARQDDHLAEIDRAEQSVVAGNPASDTAGQIVETQAIARDSLEQVDPTDLVVDAETFQFKEGGDVYGVTERLEDVDRWDPSYAGVALVWERADGTRFIVDGHQRMGLAKRAIAAGQPADEVKLNAFVLREADGWTAADVRQKAAMKNIAEGSGSVMDVAKIFRDLNGEEALRGFNIPLTSANTATALGLAKLGQEEFMMVVNGMVDARFASVIGDLVDDVDIQRAIMQEFSNRPPANSNQARIMVSEMLAAGFEKTETMDLFGGQVLAESLFRERAKVIDEAMRQVRKDKTVFKSLEEDADRIVGQGNILNRQANAERYTEGERTLAALTALANVKGPISDAINEAAAKIKAGQSISSAAKDILPAIKQQTAAEYRGRADVGEPGRIDEAPAVETPKPAKGKPIELQTLNKKQQKEVEIDFKTKQSGRNVEEHHTLAKKFQTQIARIGNELQKTLGDRIVFLNPGVKKLEDTKGKMGRKGYTDAGELTDVARAGFVVKSLDDVPAIIARIAKTYEILDEGIVVKSTGYYDQKLLVRAKDGTIAEIQIWEPKMLAAKEGQDFVDNLFPDHLKAELEGFDVPSTKDSGHKLYEAERDLYEGGELKPGKESELAEIEKRQVELYGSAISAANASWRSPIERGLPESLISAGEAGAQLPGAAPLGIKRPSAEPSAETITAGRPSQLKAAETLDQEKSRIIEVSRDTVSQDTKIIYDDPELEKMINDEMIEAQRLMDEMGDLDVPGEIKMDPDAQELVTEVRSLREEFNELDAESRMIDDMFNCLEGKS